MVCDPHEREQDRASAATIPIRCRRATPRLTNAALAGRPSDMAITMHSCRGNFRSTFIASGGYDFVAEHLLGGVDIDGYFLEYDSERAGGFEPLRFLPKGRKIVVLGLVTSKSGKLEPKDAIKRRIEEATKYVDIDQLALSRRNAASLRPRKAISWPRTEQWAKLRMIVEIAREVWG